MTVKKSPQALGYENIGKLLLEYSLPAIVAMTVSSVYNIIDRIFIGHGVGPLAISGLAITLPLMNLGVAFGALVGAGAATLVSIRLGEKREDEASLILGNTVILNLIISTVYSAVMLFFLDSILRFFGASDATLPYAREFMQVIMAGNVSLHMYMGLNNVMRASGYPGRAMIITLITVGINLALAPVFIFLFRWGIRGAALATVTAQFGGLTAAIAHFIKKTSFVRFMKGHFTLHRDIIRDIFSIGMSPFIINVSACIITIILNLQLVRYGGDFAVGAFGIINSILLCVFMIVLGLTQGMQPIAGFNYGAMQYDRVKTVFMYSVIYATLITTIGFLLGELFPHQIAMAFTNNRELISITVTGLRTVMIMYPLVGFQVIASTFFQSIGHAKISIFLTLSRQVFFLIPSLILLPYLFGLTGVWISVPAADFSATILTFLIFKTQFRKAGIQ